MSFVIWENGVEADRAAWLEAWRHWPEREPFAHPAYAALYETPSQRAVCAGWQMDAGWVLYPLLVRRIEGADLTDLITPYGYGGPFRWGNGDARTAHGFWREFNAWACREKAVSEFVRFSLFREHLLEDYPGQRIFRMHNVVRDLDVSQDALWQEVEHKVRKNVKRARACGITVAVDAAGELLADFLRIYYGTMDRCGAAELYRFPEDYFERLVTGLQGSYVFLHAMLDGKVVASELVLLSRHHAYSFLGGTDSAYFDCRPNDILKFEIIRWAAEAGKRAFVLGGGHSPADGIFRYKKAFAPHGEREFFVGRRILDGRSYERLVSDRRAQLADWQPAPDFFPVYRA
jgi:Acetyltransferase (GNAT) domain